MKIRILKFGIIFIAFILLLSGPPLNQFGFGTQPAHAQALPPTEALHLIFHELLTHPKEQPAIAKKYLDLVLQTTTVLEPEEQFALGEVYFVAIMPKESKESYAKFTSDLGWKGSVARERVVFMTAVAEQNFDEAEKQLYGYRKEFRPVNMDRLSMSPVVSVLAGYYQSKGDEAKVVRLVEDEVNSLPHDAPYWSFRLPATFFDSFEKTGKSGEALKMLQKARRVLKAAVAKRHDLSVQIISDQEDVQHRAGVFHRREALLKADFPEERLLASDYKELIDYLDAEIAKHLKPKGRQAMW